MRWSVTSTQALAQVGDALVIPVCQVDKQADLEPLLSLVGEKRKRGKESQLATLIRAGGFTAKAESTFALPCAEAKAGWLMLVGLGSVEEVGLDTLRRCAGKTAKALRARKARRVVVHMPDQVLAFDDQTIARCWVEGAEMALTPTGVLKTVSAQKKHATKGPDAWHLAMDRSRARAMRKGVAEAEAYVAGCLVARQLVNEPPNHLTPARLAARARTVARAEGFKCRVLGVAQLKKLGMGGLLGVGQGSSNAPCLIEVEYRGPKSRGANLPTIGLVGKGITFDSGGISLKPGANMDIMKSDMAGAAAVLGAVLIVARLKLPVHVIGVMPAAENMPDGKAVKPADIVKMGSGKTVEILNTDAEGRLVLADALWYVGRRKPDYIVDIATLTGSIVVALGKHFAGVMGHSGELIDVLRQAGGETFERVWHMPLVDEHKKIMTGTWADLTNIGGSREGGALTAAAFLANFVPEETPWVHLDIAGTAWAESETASGPKGGTGFGARLLARALQILVS